MAIFSPRSTEILAICSWGRTVGGKCHRKTGMFDGVDDIEEEFCLMGDTFLREVEVQTEQRIRSTPY